VGITKCVESAATSLAAPTTTPFLNRNLFLSGNIILRRNLFRDENNASATSAETSLVVSTVTFAITISAAMSVTC
jgi:hypothetical protein